MRLLDCLCYELAECVQRIRVALLNSLQESSKSRLMQRVVRGNLLNGPYALVSRIKFSFFFTLFSNCVIFFTAFVASYVFLGRGITYQKSRNNFC